MAAELDDADPLRLFPDEFLAGPEGAVVSYLDGNSLGRPLVATAARMRSFVEADWAGRLIRGWTEGWMEEPFRLGDQLGRIALGAAPGQVAFGDSTTVWLYKLASAAVQLRPGRREIVVDTDNFPTDRYVLEGIAADRGLRLRWVDTDPELGLTADQVAAAVGEDTALVVFSHVAYRSGYLADAEAITRVAHRAGALALADLSHAAGAVDIQLDRWGVDLAVGCGYKYLNGGPGAPGFGYVGAALQAGLAPPVWGWIGRRDSFTMGPGFDRADGMRGFLSGTPPVLALVPVAAGLDQLERAGLARVRAKSCELTAFAQDIVDAELTDLGVRLATPRDPTSRGSHLTLQRPGFREVTDQLWLRGVIPDYRDPDAIRIGLAPLSTRFSDVEVGLRALCDILDRT